ncbi:hypothetical protein AXG93_369s1320 [Marchantia polymorpha subsp. ruderalis]|uniref:Uncharacterized protein n=1 Tax=Marchantia polymorpha subsp. ruderalis TaxID=1480154 RepID=A0A176VSN4_MARPO|nr:hypothetical protein AXG93_369s1320 [Marchantia polymorpha subsp. ruderalis]
MVSIAAYSFSNFLQLEVPGCTGLNIDALVHTVEQQCAMSRSKGMCGIKQLRIRGIREIHEQSLFALRDMILSRNGHQLPITWPAYLSSTTIDDDRAIDVEMCPRCDSQYATVVFDSAGRSPPNAQNVTPPFAGSTRGITWRGPFIAPCRGYVIGAHKRDFMVGTIRSA